MNRAAAPLHRVPGEQTIARVLAVDDDPDVLRVLSLGLEAEGVEVICAHSADEALEVLDRDHGLDAAILDIDLSEGTEDKQPAQDGLALLKRIRASSRIPVIMLSSTDLESVKVLALDLGADDYMTKPFGPLEVGARLRAIVRRRGADSNRTKVIVDSLTVDLERREVHRDDSEIDLTYTEFELLAALARARGRVLSRNQIMNEVWGASHFGDERVVDVHVRHLRKKIEANPSRPDVIQTVRGAGYRIGPRRKT